jgi:uncharacterized protein YndB with AHSA1/START domain
MTNVRASVEINQPIEKVFTYVSDFNNDTQWWLGVVESRTISEIKQGVGTTYWQRSHFLGRYYETTFVITEFEPMKHVTLKTLESSIPFIARYTLDPIAKGTRFTMDATVEWVGFYRPLRFLFNFLMQQTAKKFFKKLKKVMESDTRL